MESRHDSRRVSGWVPCQVSKVNKLEMNEELKGRLHLRQANLNSLDKNIVLVSAGGDYYLQALSTSSHNANR